jgi:membrane associated rhomboid family serine protease
MASNEPSEKRSSRTDGLILVAAMVAVMWGEEVVDAILGGRLDRWGIEPRDPDGLTGIVLAPFLHGGFGHLISNTVPFAVMGATIALGGLARVLAVTAIVAVVSGAGTWLIGPENSVHIGASGVVFGYATYLISRGLFNRDLLQAATGVVVGAIWGTALLSGLAPQPGISWQGHLFGAIGGILAARLLARRRGQTDRERAAPTSEPAF